MSETYTLSWTNHALSIQYGYLQDDLERGARPTSYLYHRRNDSVDSLYKQLLPSYLILIILLSMKWLLQLLLTIFNDSTTWAWKQTKKSKNSTVYSKAKESMWGSYIHGKKNGTHWKRTLVHRGWKISVLFVFTTMWRLAWRISKNFPEVAMQQQLHHHGTH